MTITPATHAISINPATGEQLSVLPWAGVDDIENALQLAAAGFRDWRETNIDYRAEKLRDIGKALRARSEEMAQMITREMGKPINQARAEVAKSANLCDWYAEHGPAMLNIVSVIASVVIGGAGSLAFPLPALIWCAVRYTPQVTCLLTFVTGAVEVVLVANSVIDISVGSPFSIPQMFSARLGIATMAICPIMVSFSVAAINSLMKQVALRADFDFLTQVYSRSGLYEALKSPSLKQTQHLTVMLLDIDYFKSINDNYGHECGDKVLSVFAQHIQKIVGDKGLVARMGGEEFAVAVPSVNPVDGLLMAEKIRKGVELQPFTWQQKTLYLTVSIGVGSGCASYRTLTDDFNKLMVEADTCLYRSKKDGRNRTSTMRYGEEVV